MPIKKYEVTEYQFEALQLLRPPEKITTSQWAEQHRILDSKTSAMPGRWSNSVTPYLIGIMDAFDDYLVEEIIFCKPTQCGGSEALINMICHIIDQDPSPTLVVYPSDDLAKFTSENRLKPAFKLSKTVRNKFDEQNSAQMELHFDGMYLSLTGSNSPADLASKPIRYLFMDEVDKYPGASNKEANPIKLARERTKTFHNRKIYMTSTPTLKNGHIWKAKEGADVEKHYFVPCPHCGEYIELKFSNIRFPDEEGMSYVERAELATYVCQECGCMISDNDKHQMLAKGEWREVRRMTDNATKVAFWMNTLYSPFVRWADIAKEFLTTKDDPEELQNFVNSWLAEPWEETKLKTDAETVMERQTGIQQLVVPQWAKLLTGGVDVQETCLYWTIRAWGEYLTSQLVAHGQALSFEEVDRMMNLEYLTEEGDPMLVNLCLVDSGDQTDLVYDFCTTHSDYALPVKGSSHEQMSHYKLSRVNKEGSYYNGLTLVLVDGDKYKDMIAARMRKENGRGSWMVFDGIDADYANQVTAEHKVSIRKNGVTKLKWQPKHSNANNHYLDCEVYAMAAADIKGVRTLHLLADQEQGRPMQQTASEPEAPEEQWIKKYENWL